MGHGSIGSILVCMQGFIGSILGFQHGSIGSIIMGSRGP